MTNLDPYAGFKYLATPFSSRAKDPTEKQQEEWGRYMQAVQLSSKLLSEGLVVFSPIVYAYHLADLYNLPTDNNYWRDFNLAFIRKSSGLIVAKFPGWDKSLGIRDEIIQARKHSIKVEYLEP